MSIQLRTVSIKPPEGTNVILGIAHFIKTPEDLYEALVNSVPSIKFGLAFCEASGRCLIRHEGNDDELRDLAKRIALDVGAGHSFIILMKNAYPINVLRKLKDVPEVCNILCASANPLEVIVAETGQGVSIIGVVDGFKAKGIESDEDVKERRELLRRMGYKL